MLVVSGPGSGKTTVITQRLKNLVSNITLEPDQRILVITFTKNAALEMEGRFIKKASENACRHIEFGTFHGIFYKLLRRYGFNKYKIIDEDEKLSILLHFLVENYNYSLTEGKILAAEISHLLSINKNTCQYKSFLHQEQEEEDYKRKIICQYEEYLDIHSYMDFDSLLIKMYDLLHQDSRVLKEIQHTYPFILVDEFQDINEIQYEIIKMIAGAIKNIFCVGDDDQSIYGFRGSSPAFMQHFCEDFNCLITYLNTNYRCSSRIVQFSSNLIAGNQNRFEKKLKSYTTLPGRAAIKYFQDDKEELWQLCQHIKKKSKGKSFAILIREHAQEKLIIDRLMDFDIGFHKEDCDYNPFNHWLIEEIISFMNSIHQPAKEDCTMTVTADREEYLYHLNEMSRMSLKQGIAYLWHIYGLKNQVKAYCKKYMVDYKYLYRKYKLVLRLSRFKSFNQWIMLIHKYRNAYILKDPISLMTIHGSKGLEFDEVWIPCVVQGVIPHSKSMNDMEEERRILYVAATRAAKALTLSIPMVRQGLPVQPSVFLQEPKSDV